MNIFFYDSKCGMCSSFVSFLTKRVDPSVLTFECLHSEKARLTIGNISGKDPDMRTSYLLLGNSLYEKSDAIFNSISLCKSKVIKNLIKPLIYINSYVCFHNICNFFYDQISSRRKTCVVKF